MENAEIEFKILKILNELENYIDSDSINVVPLITILNKIFSREELYEDWPKKRYLVEEILNDLEKRKLIEIKLFEEKHLGIVGYEIEKEGIEYYNSLKK